MNRPSAAERSTARVWYGRRRLTPVLVAFAGIVLARLLLSPNDTSSGRFFAALALIMLLGMISQ